MTTHNKMADFIMAHLFSLAVDRHKVTGFLPSITGNMAIPSKPCMIKQQELCWLYSKSLLFTCFTLFFSKYQKCIENPNI